MSNNNINVALTLAIQLIEAGLEISSEIRAKHALNQGMTDADLGVLFDKAAAAHQAALAAIAGAKQAGR